MTTTEHVIWRIAAVGLVKRDLTDDQRDTLGRSWRWMPEPLTALVSERTALYGDVAMAAADALEAWWHVTGVAMTVAEWCEVMDVTKGLTDEFTTNKLSRRRRTTT